MSIPSSLPFKKRFNHQEPLPAPLNNNNHYPEQVAAPAAPQNIASAAVKLVRSTAKKKNYNEDPSPAERYENFALKPSYHDGIKLFDTFVKSKPPAYKEAFEVAKILFDWIATETVNDTQTKVIITKFSNLIDLGQEALGKDFYAWLRCTLSWHLERNILNQCDLNDNIKTVIEGYKESAKLGNFTAHYNLASYYTGLGRFQEAREAWVECSQKFPNYSHSFKEAGLSFQYGWNEETIDLQRAEQFYAAGYALGCPECAECLATLLQTTCVATNEERQRVVDLYTFAKDKGDDFTACQAAFNLGVIYQTGWYKTSAAQEREYSDDQKNLELALSNFKTSLARDSKVDESQTGAIACAIAETIFMDQENLTEEKHQEAMKHLESAIAAKSLDAAVLYAQLLMHGNGYLEKDTDGAITALEALDKDTSASEPALNLDVLISLGELYLQKSKQNQTQISKCITALVRAQDVLAHVELKALETKIVKSEQIEALLLKARSSKAGLKQRIEELTLQNSTLKTLADTKTEETMQLQARVSQLESRDKQLVAKINQVQSGFKSAIHRNLELEIQKLEKLLQQDPDNLTIKLKVSAIYSKLGNIDKALDIYSTIIEKHPNDNWKAWVNKAILYSKKKDFQNALICINNSIERRNNNGVLYACKYRILLALDLKNDAEQAAAKAKELNVDAPNFKNVHLFL